MATYKFEQFNVQIANPVVSIDMNTIGDKAIDKLLSVNITLTTQDAEFGVRLEDMPYEATWDDSDISDIVNTKLQEYIVF
jgi:hypothetical protein